MTDYYFSQSLGADPNSGTSMLTPKKTAAAHNAMSFSPGDTISVLNGDLWRETWQTPSAGASGNPIVYKTYGAGPRPITSGADIKTGWSGTTPANTYTINLGATHPTAILVTLADGSKRFLQENIVSQASLVDGFFFYSNPNLFICLTNGNPDTILAVVEVAQRSYCWYMPATKSYNTVDGWECQMGNDKTFFASATGPVFKNGVARYNGGWGIHLGVACPNFQVSNFRIEETFQDGIYANESPNGVIDQATILRTYSAAGDGIQVSGTSVYSVPVTITGCFVQWVSGIKGCYTVTNGGTGAVTVRGCIGLGSYWGMLIEGGVVPTNSVVNANLFLGMSLTSSNGCITFGSLFDGYLCSYNVTSGGLQGVQQAGTGNTTNLKFYHNTHVLPSNRGLSFSGTISGEIKNVLVYAPGATSYLYRTEAFTGGGMVADWNFYGPEYTNCFRYNAVNSSTLVALQSASSQDAHSLTGDPLFGRDVAVAATPAPRSGESVADFFARAKRQYQLDASSRLVNAGSVVAGVTTGYSGTAPDIGVGEWQGEPKR